MLELNLFLQTIGNSFFDKLFLIISYLVTDIPLVAALCYVYWCISKKKGIKIGFILLNGMQINFIVKDIFKIERPYLKNDKIINKDIKYGYGYSFPSNHSQLSSSLLYSVRKYFNINRYFIYGLILVLLVGLSRIYLGVHSIIDVLTGFLLGYLMVKLFGCIIDKIIESKKYYFAFLFVILGIIGSVFFKNEDSLTIMYLYIGFLIGFLIENRFIGYKVPDKLFNKIINYIIGVLGITVIYMFIDSNLKFFVLGIWITLVAPYIFKLLKRR